MNDGKGVAGPQFRADRPEEQQAVRTTIVGGRPPGSGQAVGKIPRGIEVLVKKASVDAAFRDRLLDGRAEAAAEIGLELEPAEAALLASAPRQQLEAIIQRTTVPEEHRRTFLSQAAAAMLAALCVMEAGCDPAPPTKGIRPDAPTKGIRPDTPLRKEESAPTSPSPASPSGEKPSARPPGDASKPPNTSEKGP